MIGLAEACKLVQEKIGSTCRIMDCYELPDFYMFDVHRRSSGIYAHDRATALGHCIDKKTGEYRRIEDAIAINLLDKAIARDPFPYMTDDDIKVVKAIRNTY